MYKDDYTGNVEAFWMRISSNFIKNVLQRQEKIKEND